MMIMVLGGSASGKSEFAESCCMKLCERNENESKETRKNCAGNHSPFKPVYLATMINSGNSSKARIIRHRTLREGKGFITVECPMHVDRASVPHNSVVLLECLSNLLANEMFAPAENDEENTDR